MSSYSPQHILERTPELGAPPSPGRRALVTGATGFIGGRLAQTLSDAGWIVRCLARDRSRGRDLERCGFPFEHFIVEAGRGMDFDVMLEAKAKDLALLRLREQLAGRTDGGA